MPLKFVLGLALCLISGCNSHKDTTSLLDTTPQEHPYMVTVKGLDYCSGVLISAEHVLVPASCVCEVPKVAVLLGFAKYPYFIENREDPHGQIVLSTEIILHDDYYKIQQHRHLNNLAIIKLPHPVNLTENVHPAKILHPEDTLQLEGSTVKIVGWRLTTNANLKETEVKLRNQDTCFHMFGHQLFRDQELCVKWPQKGHLNLIGNPVSFKGKIIGFQTDTPNCKWPGGDCSPNDFILLIAPYVDWINEHAYGHIVTKISKRDEEVDAKLTYLLTILEQLKEEQKGDKVLLEEVIETIKKSIQENKQQGLDIAVRLNEEINGVKTEIRNRDLMHNSSIYKLQEDISDSRQEFSNGLSAQKSYHKDLEKRVDALDSKSPLTDKTLEHIQQTLQSLETQSDLTKSSFQHITDELTEEIKKVKRHVEHLEEVFGKFKNSSLSTGEQLVELDEHIHHIHKEIDEFNPRIAAIETIADETRQRLDSQIVSSFTNFQNIQKEYVSISKNLEECCKKNDYFYGPSTQ